MDVSTQNRIVSLFKPNPEDRYEALRALSPGALEQEPFRVAVATLACDRNDQVREAALGLLESINPPALA